MRLCVLPMSLLSLGVVLLIGPFQGSRAAAEESAGKKHGPIAWVESFQKAQQVAKKKNKVLMVDFWAEWCAPCRQMLSTTYKNKAVVNRSKKLVPVLVDFDKNADLAKKYEIEALPTVLFLNPSGSKVLLRVEGYRSAAEFSKLMDKAIKKAKS
jgi:thiol:disulfide interchange protein